MWIRLILSLATVVFGAFIGYVASSTYRERAQFFTQLHALNERYLSELSYARRPLKSFLAEQRFEGAFAQTIKGFLEGKGKISCDFLQKEDAFLVNEYFSALGVGDARGQQAFFSSQKAVLLERKNACEKEGKARTHLYVKLGLLAGLAVVILVV